MSYKVNLEKGVDILKSVNPPLIVVNGLISTNKKSLAKKLKEIEFSVLEVGIADEKSRVRTRNYLRKAKTNFPNTPIVLKTNFLNPEELNTFLGEILYTVVFMYPNNQKSYHQRLVIDSEEIGDITIPENYPESIKSAAKEKNLHKLVIELCELNKKTYEDYLNYFDERLLTILV
jgi:hypothetical protein